MMNLFSVFDPVSYFGIELNWMVVLVFFSFFLWWNYYFVNGNIYVYMLIRSGLSVMFSEISSGGFLGLVYLSIGVFYVLLMINLLGMFPYVFTASAHILMTLSLGLVMWVSFFIMGWVNNFNNSLAHLVPHGSPIVLAPFMVIIESVSHIIRPFTLSVRLAANMMAGHLIVGLLAFISELGGEMILMSVFMQTLLLLLELCVCVIQSFVFSVLLMLYVTEYY